MDSVAAGREHAAGPAFAAGPGPVFAAGPAQGRLFTTSRLVRGTDVTPAGRLRFDAFARYLQEAAEDDVADTGWAAPYDWRLRRCEVAIRGYPGYGELVSLRTFCSATGPRWAERTTTLAGPGGDLMQARAVWVAIARADGRPCPLGEMFHRLYGAAAQGRGVSTRLTHPGPPASQAGTSWPLRASDFDPAGHVGNTVHWAAVEDILAQSAALPVTAELEYHRPMLPGQQPRLVTTRIDGQVWAWLLADTQRLASARLVFPGSGPSVR
ncbi:MAG TPA: acyl-ACP thioesterase domain-containing protein [Streptosporangiaceae bacterium]|jgi:acyl-ACP thioesterase|nr:acyl-ACP thioesterase domain-containing protein [Streptosporangiaceae bacterium]